MSTRLASLVFVLALSGGVAGIAAAQDPPPAVEQPQETTAEAPRTEVDALFERGLRQYRNRDFRQALESFERVVELAPDHAAAHYLIGYCHLMLRDYEASLRAFARAFEADPELDPRTIYRRRS